MESLGDFSPFSSASIASLSSYFPLLEKRVSAADWIWARVNWGWEEAMSSRIISVEERAWGSGGGGGLAFFFLRGFLHEDEAEDEVQG